MTQSSPDHEFFYCASLIVDLHHTGISLGYRLYSNEAVKVLQILGINHSVSLIWKTIWAHAWPAVHCTLYTVHCMLYAVHWGRL